MTYTGHLLDIGEAVDGLAREHAEWSQATFKSDAERGPIGPLRHLQKEASEAVEAVESGDREKVREELADCLLLILDASRRAGVKPLELFKCGMAKLQVNKRRKWNTPQPDAPVEHVRDG